MVVTPKRLSRPVDSWAIGYADDLDAVFGQAFLGLPEL
jgi:hypothetical protein